MTREEQSIYERLCAEKKAGHLPKGYIVEKAWPWEHDTHICAPDRKDGAGGVVVKWRTVKIQWPNTSGGPCADTTDVCDRQTGRGWQDKLVKFAVRAAHTHQIARRPAEGRMKREA